MGLVDGLSLGGWKPLTVGHCFQVFLTIQISWAVIAAIVGPQSFSTGRVISWIVENNEKMCASSETESFLRLKPHIGLSTWENVKDQNLTVSVSDPLAQYLCHSLVFK